MLLHFSVNSVQNIITQNYNCKEPSPNIRFIFSVKLNDNFPVMFPYNKGMWFENKYLFCSVL